MSDQTKEQERREELDGRAEKREPQKARELTNEELEHVVGGVKIVKPKLY